MAKSYKWKRNSGWAKVEWRGAEKGFQRELIFELAPQLKKAITNTLIDVNDSFVRDLPDREAPMLPFITGNLRDSIVGIVSDNTTLVKASFPTPVATTTSEKSGKRIYTPTKGGGRKRIIGHQEAWKVVYGNNGRYPGKLASTMFVSVPYALRPEERGPHRGYLENLRDLYAAAVDIEMRQAGKAFNLWNAKNVDSFIPLLYDQDDMRIARLSSGKKGKKKQSNGGGVGPYRTGTSMKLMP